MHITSLPVEVLLKIFECASKDTEDDKGAKAIFRLVGLCRDWRTLLLDYPPAWSVVCLAHPVATELMLQRSKTAPVYIRLDLRGRIYPDTARRASLAQYALRRALDRTRELTIIDGDRLMAYYVDPVVGMLRSPALALDTLELMARGQSERRPTYSIGHNLARGSQLKTLTLHDTLLHEAEDLLASHCTSLVHLDLRAVRGLSFPALLSLLAAAQTTLKTLKLDSLELSNEPENASAESIHLPALRELSLLSIESPVTRTSHATLLEYIAHPRTVRFAVHVRAKAAALHVLDAQATLTAYLAGRGYEFQSVLLGPTDLGLRLRCWPEREELDLYNVIEHPPALLDLRVSHASDASLRTAASVLSSLAKASHVASVGRAVVAPLEEGVPWARVLVRMPDLNDLSVHGPKNLRNLRHACTVTADSGAHNIYMPAELASAGTPFLANLATLNVYGLVLTATPEERYGNHAELAMVMTSLSRRLQELRVRHCNMRSEYCEPLAALIENASITWDGIEEGIVSLPIPTQSADPEAAEVQEHVVSPLSAEIQEERWRSGVQQARIIAAEAVGWNVAPPGGQHSTGVAAFIAMERYAALAKDLEPLQYL